MTHRVFLFLEFFEEEEKDSKQGIAGRKNPGRKKNEPGARAGSAARLRD